MLFRSPGFNIDDIKNILIPLPPKNRQDEIVDFLDKKCALIDKMISSLYEEITLTKEYFSRFIREKIAKKTDRSIKLKYLIHGMKTGPFGSDLKGDDFKDYGVPVFNQRVVLDDFNGFDAFVTEKKFSKLISCRASSGDILITTRGTIGKIAIVPVDTIGLLHPCIIKFRENENECSPMFLKYLFNFTDILLEQLKQKSTATTIDVIYSYNLKEIQIPWLSLQEQKELVEIFDSTYNNIKELIAIKESKIIEYKNYKKAVIYESLIGKRGII